MPIILAPLPYGTAALEPHISAETVKLHHGKHHAGYVDKTNALAKEADLGATPLEEIIGAARKSGNDQLFNLAAQVWNHGFYWHSLTPEQTKPSAGLGRAIDASFGGLAQLKQELAAAATDHFASGWAWLVATKDKLAIEDTHDAATLARSRKRPLLVIDVWEHAYYLDRQNLRKAYVEAVTGQLLNWDFASANFAAEAGWTYPAA
jgi:Fe-Mn family superoxide dismutase